MKKRLTAVLLIIVMLMGVFTSVSFASSSKVKKMNVYNLIKDGDIVYCQNGQYIFKVNVKTQNVVRLAYVYRARMKLNGNYLYYCADGTGLYGDELYRINLKTNTKKLLAEDVNSFNYVIKGKKIYYGKVVASNGKYGYTIKKRVMKLNGKNKESTNYKAKGVLQEANISGYYVWNDFDFDKDEWPCKVNYYLRTPEGNDIFLENNWTAN